MKLSAIFLGSLIILVGCLPDGFLENKRPDFEDRVVEEILIPQALVPAQPEIPPLPTQVSLAAPFYPQAPEGDWSAPWKEACEEASLVLAHYGLSGQNLTMGEFKEIILEMVEWEKAYFGYYEDTTLAQTAEMYHLFFVEKFNQAFTRKILNNPTAEDLKRELAQGHLIVAPFAGRMLKNPHYSNEGPYYHMLVIKGYDEVNFITNDVGTRLGENFAYPQETLMDALHDYVEPGIEKGEKTVMVLSK